MGLSAAEPCVRLERLSHADSGVPAHAIAQVTVSHPARYNAMTRGMWQELRQVFTTLSQDQALRCIWLRGEGGQFCAGGDISEYPDFRFDEAALAHFHEVEVWGGLAAMLDCDIPIVAGIHGHCMGAGLELACCADIRIAADDARFGAPIARLGFPMAPKEASLLLAALGPATVAETLLEARVFDAATLRDRGFLQRVVPAAEVAAEALATCLRVARGAPHAARQNKRTWRALRMATSASERAVDRPYAYADTTEHREGIAAFLAKRAPIFEDL